MRKKIITLVVAFVVFIVFVPFRTDILNVLNSLLYWLWDVVWMMPDQPTAGDIVATAFEVVFGGLGLVIIGIVYGLFHVYIFQLIVALFLGERTAHLVARSELGVS